ncbi:MAG: Recombination protein RecR [Candidatus Anoxychlamydiales bacterium]|nr:Recombination protein RecR [Candidatus Anoxychlamydiales bacterium]NGX36266.1 Recombination protein RecR [Candidatus Anoxychlamydiales bacterium]
MYPKDLLKLISYLSKLPGVGSKTASRFAFELLKWKEGELEKLADILKNSKKNIIECETCGCLISDNYCQFCDPNLRDSKKLCIVSSFKEVFLLENTKSFKGFYHIIENLISPLDGLELDEKNIKKLKDRIEKDKIKEVIIALDSTLEGDATALFIKDELSALDVNISRLAFGIPMGTSLDYIDGGTLTQAFIGRQSF